MSATLSTLKGKKVVYARKRNTVNAFAWLGKCSRFAGVNAPLGDITVTYRHATQVGKFEVDQKYRGVPGATTGSLIMKETVRSAIYEDLIHCAWDIDIRFQSCGRVDDPANWDMIKRLCDVDMTSVATDDESAFSPSDEGETMVTAAASSLNFPVMLYKVSGARVGESDLVTYTLNHVSVLEQAKCADECGPDTDCKLVASAVADSPQNPPAYGISVDGGRTWTINTISVFTNATTLSDIAGLGQFIVAVAAGEPGYAYSWDGGANWALVDDSQVPTFTANPPLVVEVLSFNKVLLGGENGYVWLSSNGGVTAAPVDEGVVTYADINRISFANDNVVYATGASNTAKKSLNGGQTWEALTLPVGKAGDSVTALMVVDERIVIIGYGTTGGVYYTLDGGATWTQDTSISSTAIINGFTMCDCGVIYAAGRVGGVGVIYRNVDYGAPSRWYEVNVDTPGTLYYDIACCGPNHAVAVGASTGVYDAGLVTLIQ